MNIASDLFVETDALYEGNLGSLRCPRIKVGAGVAGLIKYDNLSPTVLISPATPVSECSLV